MEESFNCKETFEIKVEIDSENRKILNEYLFLKKLGQGSFSKVKLARNINNNKEYAIKIINKRVLERQNKSFTKDDDGNIIITNSLQDALREMAILKKLNHPNVIKLYEIIHDVECGKIYLVSEVAEKGNLLNYDDFTGEFSLNPNFIETGQKYYSEDQIRIMFRDMVRGLDYLHANGVVHRDIKPDNILINGERVCKITDFNVSVMFDKKQSDQLSNTKGTVFFYAPEMCHKDNPEQTFAGKPLDIWALGVTLYVMTFNKLPIRGEDDGNMMEILDLISEAKICFPGSEEREISEDLRELILIMLEKDPTKRATTEQIKRNKWINLGLPELSEEVFKVVEVTEEEIKNSLKLFYTLMKTKKIAKEFKTKLTQLSLKRKEMKKKESLVLQDPRFKKEVEDAKKNNQTQEESNQYYSNEVIKTTESNQNEVKGNEENLKTTLSQDNSVKGTIGMETIENEIVFNNNQNTSKTEIPNRSNLKAEQTENNSILITDNIKIVDQETKIIEAGNLIKVVNENTNGLKTEQDGDIQIDDSQIDAQEQSKEKEMVSVSEPNREKGEEILHEMESNPNLYKGPNKEISLRNDQINEKEGNKEIESNQKNNDEIQSGNMSKSLNEKEEIVVNNKASFHENEKNPISEGKNEKENEENLSIIDRPTLKRKQLNKETNEFSKQLNENKNEPETKQTPIPERKCCLIF